MSSTLQELTESLYETFGVYSATSVFSCSFCYSKEELEYYASTTPRALSVDESRRMLWETCDHWSGVDAYKRSLPRIFEIMGPPFNEEDLFADHLFQVLSYLGFNKWPEHEQKAVTTYLEAVSETFENFDKDDWEAWSSGVLKLGEPNKMLEVTGVNAGTST